MSAESDRTASLRSRTKEMRTEANANDNGSQKCYKHSYMHIDLNDDQVVGGGKERQLTHFIPGITVTEKGKESDKRLDQHQGYEFGGPIGVTAMMTLFPVLMYYLWICLWFYDGKLVAPASVNDIQPFFKRMGQHIYQVRFLFAQSQS